MRMIDHVRWHLTLILTGALLIPWMSWQITTLLPGTIALERGLRLVSPQTARKNDAMPPDHPTLHHMNPANIGVKPVVVASKVPLALLRLWDALCFDCHGTGCHECAHTGLR